MAAFRVEDTARRAEYAFAASFSSGEDLRALEDERLPLGARALPAALADFRADGTRVRQLLDEMFGSDLTLADLYLRAIVEEDPKMTMVGELLRPDMFERLRQLESFREYEAKVKAEAAETANARVAEANARAAESDARAAKAEAEAAAAGGETRAATIAGNLTEFLTLRGDAVSDHATNTISTCRNHGVLSAWLRRAYLGETAEQIFPEPKPRTS